MNNYQAQTDKMLNSLQYKPKLLLHTCCAPCATYVTDYLKEHFKLCLFYYNPNISPFDEYNKRLDEAKRLAEHYDVEFLCDDWENDKFEEWVKGYTHCKEGGERCRICIEKRLNKTALVAKQNDFEFFTTSLSISPLKSAKLINELGEQIENSIGIKHLTSDFKKRDGYKKSTVLSNELGFYRQNYCGCKYSIR